MIFVIGGIVVAGGLAWYMMSSNKEEEPAAPTVEVPLETPAEIAAEEAALAPVALPAPTCPADPIDFDVNEPDVPAHSFACPDTCNLSFANVQWGANGKFIDATKAMNDWCGGHSKCTITQGFNNLVGDPIGGVVKRVTGRHICMPKTT